MLRIEFSGLDALWIESFTERLAECATLDAAEATLRTQYPSFFVYRGGSHVAVHGSRESSAPRLLIVSVAR